jgi:hypothetical protein
VSWDATSVAGLMATLRATEASLREAMMSPFHILNDNDFDVRRSDNGNATHFPHLILQERDDIGEHA